MTEVRRAQVEGGTLGTSTLKEARRTKHWPRGGKMSQGVREPESGKGTVSPLLRRRVTKVRVLEGPRALASRLT